MSIWRSVKQKIKYAAGMASHIKKEVDCRCEWYGNSYGGFYVCPDKLDDQSIVYSFGIGGDVSFDTAIIARHGGRVFAFDPTPKVVDWAKNQQFPEQLRFFGYGIHTVSGSVEFNLPKNPDHVSGSVSQHNEVDAVHSVSVPMKCFADIVRELGHTHIDVLKMDIEGSEYAVIGSILASPVKIDQIALEIHERFFPDGTAKTRDLMKTLHDHGYRVFGVSDRSEEISFIRV